MLVCNDADGGSYDLCIVPKDASRTGDGGSVRVTAPLSRDLFHIAEKRMPCLLVCGLVRGGVAGTCLMPLMHALA